MNLPDVEFISTPLYVRLSCGYLPWQADFFCLFIAITVQNHPMINDCKYLMEI